MKLAVSTYHRRTLLPRHVFDASCYGYLTDCDPGDETD